MKTHSLGEICDKTLGTIRTGPFGSQLHQTDYVQSGTPVVMPQDIVNNRISKDKISFINDDLAKKLAKHSLKKDDIIFPRRGDISKRAIISKEQEGYICGTGCIKIRIPSQEILPLWLFYYLGLPHIVKWIENKAIGSTMLNLNTEILRSTPIEYPSIEEQLKTSNTLLTYDKLIDDNQKRITLLEEASHLIYREWFVYMRLQGQKSKTLNNNPPKTWERKNLFEVCDVSYGYPFKSNHFNSASLGTPAVRIRDIPNISTSTFTTETVDESYTIERGDFLIGMDGIFHMNHWVGPKAYLVQRVCKVRPRDDKFLAYIGLALRDPIKIFETTIQGATVAHLGAKHLKQIEINVPVGLDEELGILNDLLWQQIHLREMNMQLAQARDLLLPKLMSGQIDVSNIRLTDEDVVM